MKLKRDHYWVRSLVSYTPQKSNSCFLWDLLLLAYETYSTEWGKWGISRITQERWNNMELINFIYSHLLFSYRSTFFYWILPALSIPGCITDLCSHSRNEVHWYFTCHFILSYESIHLQLRKDAQDLCLCKQFSSHERIHLFHLTFLILVKACPKSSWHSVCTVITRIMEQ